ncbi:MAG: hypothetical protein H6752_05340 [Candidatus Omnitrophica bacterium]|nr:hypothetical protein [Candidatus Omnitrophota bacterium]
MRGTLDQSEFQDAVLLVQGIAQSKISNPVVENVVLRFEKERAEILATNLSISIRVRLGIDSAEPGEIALPAKLLGQVVREIPHGKVDLTSKVRSSKSRLAAPISDCIRWTPKIFLHSSPRSRARWWRSRRKWPPRRSNAPSLPPPRNAPDSNSEASSSLMPKARRSGSRPMAADSPESNTLWTTRPPRTARCWCPRAPRKNFFAPCRARATCT